MSWEGAIHSERQSGEIVRLRVELERAYQQIKRLEQKLGESGPGFYQCESMDSSSPYWMHLGFVSN